MRASTATAGNTLSPARTEEGSLNRLPYFKGHVQGWTEGKIIVNGIIPLTNRALR